MGQMACALELKPYLHNNDDPWKKNWHFKHKHWNGPCWNQNGQIWPKKAYHSTCTLKAPNELCFGT